MSGKTTPATKAARQAGVEFALHEYRLPAGDEGYGMGAARALGVEPARVFKTLIVVVDGKNLGVAIVPVAKQVSLKAAAAVLGGKKATMAEPKLAEKATGYVVGGISPLGQRKRLPKAIDRSVLDLDKAIVSAGRRGLMMELAVAELIRLSGAEVGELC